MLERSEFFREAVSSRISSAGVVTLTGTLQEYLLFIRVLVVEDILICSTEVLTIKFCPLKPFLYQQYTVLSFQSEWNTRYLFFVVVNNTTIEWCKIFCRTFINDDLMNQSCSLPFGTNIHLTMLVSMKTKTTCLLSTMSSDEFILIGALENPDCVNLIKVIISLTISLTEPNVEYFF